ncbi:MAG: hypothetical protein AAFX94_09410, partial [Myxococcota bacterium]
DSGTCEDLDGLVDDCCGMLSDAGHQARCRSFIVGSADGAITASENFCASVVDNWTETDSNNSCRSLCESTFADPDAATAPTGGETFAACSMIAGPEGVGCDTAGQCFSGLECSVEEDATASPLGACAEPAE